MEYSSGFSDEEWILTPLLCAHQAKIPLELRWSIWENTSLSDQEKVPIYKYWADQFAGVAVLDEDIAVSGDTLVYPDEGRFRPRNGTFVYTGTYTPTPEDYFIRPARLYMPVTGQGEGFLLYGEPYQDPYKPQAK